MLAVLVESANPKLLGAAIFGGLLWVAQTEFMSCNKIKHSNALKSDIKSYYQFNALA